MRDDRNALESKNETVADIVREMREYALERERRAKMSLAELSRELVAESDRILGRAKSEETRAKDRERARIKAAKYRAARKAAREAETAKAKGGAE